MEFYDEDSIMPENALQYPFSSHMETHSEGGVIAHAHYHEYIEILYCLDGSVRIYLEGAEYVALPGDMLVINSKEVHHIFGEDGGLKYLVVKFTPDLLYTSSKFLFEAQYVIPFLHDGKGHQKLFRKSEIETTSIPGLIQEIYQEYRSREYGFELAVRTDLCRIFLWILRGWHRQGFSPLPEQPLSHIQIQKLEQGFTYALRHFAEDITVQEAARLCSMSYSYFSRLFKQCTGKSFREYLTGIRISEAEKLLTTTDFSITEIAGRTGFSTSSYFIQQFRQLRKISPLQYRNRFKNITEKNVTGS